MPTGARTPEELDPLLEDALVLHDRAACDALFDDAAVLLGGGGLEARGGEAIGRALTARRGGPGGYVSRPGRVVRSRDTALVLAGGAIHVLRRGADGAWRAVISLLDPPTPTRPEDA